MEDFQSKTQKPKICILLTATIDPKGVVFMKRNDPVIRENDYINSIKMWVENTVYSILFCENSGYECSKIEKKLKEYMNRKTEFLQFNGQDFPRELGKGYGELQTIKYAIQYSNLIKGSDYVIKINGRYFMKNIEKIVSALSHSKDIYVMADLKRDLTWGDSRVFAFKPSFILNYLSKFQDLINDSKGFYLEHALARAVLRAISDGHKWIPLPSKPIIVGYSGTSDTPYRVSKIRWLAGEIIHRVKKYLIERY